VHQRAKRQVAELLAGAPGWRARSLSRAAAPVLQSLLEGLQPLHTGPGGGLFDHWTATSCEASAVLLRRDGLPALVLGLTAAAKVTSRPSARPRQPIV